MQALFQHVNYPPTKMMLLGGICSAATAPIAECSQLLNLIQVENFNYTSGIKCALREIYSHKESSVCAKKKKERV